MNKNNVDFSDNVVRMEKYAANKKGLILLISIVILVLGIGGYFLYKNKNNINFEFTLPWKDNEKQNEENKENDNDEKNDESDESSESEFAKFTILDKTIYDKEGIKLNFSDFQKGKEEYTFDITLTSYNSKSGTISCDKILVDGYDTSSSFVFNKINTETEDPYISTYKVSIKKSDLLSSFITEFNYIKFFLKIEYEGERPINTQTDIYTDINIMLNNESRKIKKKIAEKDNVVISYWDKKENNDYHYYYLLLMGNRGIVDYNIIVKKLLINNNLESYKDFDVEIRNNSRKIAYIKIPKSEYKEINSIDISFMLYEKNNPNGNVYITNQVEILK